MHRPWGVLIIAAVAVALSGCAGAAPGSPTTTPTASESAETPTATPEPTFVPVDPAAYATGLADLYGEGVDFDSADGNVRCGIWAAWTAYDDAGTASVVPYAGCRPLEAEYRTDPSADGEVGCAGGQLEGAAPAAPVCNGGAVFAGEDPATYAVSRLDPGTSIAAAGVTCEAVDEAVIRCIRDADGAGFEIGRSPYRYF